MRRPWLVNVEKLQSQQLPINIPQAMLRRLEEAVYDADDLFDEVATVSHLKKLMPGNKLSKEVSLFFSRFNQLSYAFTKSREIRKIREILDDIAKNHHDFGGMYQPLVEEDLIIGRDEDKSILMNMLLHTTVEENVSVVSIVGIGGLGKTALAKLVYNDDTIQRHFSLKMWKMTKIESDDLLDIGKDMVRKCFNVPLAIRHELTGVILSCKMHDLVHDLAKEVSGIGIASSSNDIHSLHDDKARHMLIDDTFVINKDVECYYTKMKRMKHLRVLDLSEVDGNARRYMKKVPSIIGELLHLRYLDLSNNHELIALPNSITRLHNLQTLKLNRCMKLEELPRKLSKLTNLRHLDLQQCYGLTHMPRGMNNMHCLHKLTRFLVGDVKNNVGCLEVGDVGKLEDLKCLNNLRDFITISVDDGCTYNGEKLREGGYLINKPLLNHVTISWQSDDNAEELLQGLQPHPNVKKLSLYYYPGVRFPSWGHSSMNLVDIYFEGCLNLEHIPLLSQLHHLKSKRKSGDELVFFPSLTKLELFELKELKGWWRKSALHSEVSSTTSRREGEMRTGNVDHNNSNEQQKEEEEEDASLLEEFPCPSYLTIQHCGKLTSIPRFPKLKELKLYYSNILLGHLNSLPMESFQQLSYLHIHYDVKLEILATMEVFRNGHLSSLRSLIIDHYNNLKSISGPSVWRNFTALETLKLWYNPELELEEEEDSNNNGEREEKDDNCKGNHNGNGNGRDMQMPILWRWLAPTLHSLSLRGLPKMVRLPKEMQYLTSLHSLEITNCINLEEIPAWIHCLPSLVHLEIH
ncbi:putative disease resistance protein RGA1 [Bienertia sinuspersici]